MPASGGKGITVWPWTIAAAKNIATLAHRLGLQTTQSRIRMTTALPQRPPTEHKAAMIFVKTDKTNLENEFGDCYRGY
jgi:hypothetical protein